MLCMTWSNRKTIDDYNKSNGVPLEDRKKIEPIDAYEQSGGGHGIYADIVPSNKHRADESGSNQPEHSIIYAELASTQPPAVNAEPASTQPSAVSAEHATTQQPAVTTNGTAWLKMHFILSFFCLYVLCLCIHWLKCHMDRTQGNAISPAFNFWLKAFPHLKFPKDVGERWGERSPPHVSQRCSTLVGNQKAYSCILRLKTKVK